MERPGVEAWILRFNLCLDGDELYSRLGALSQTKISWYVLSVGLDRLVWTQWRQE
jgi:hypothetical protein